MTIFYGKWLWDYSMWYFIQSEIFMLARKSGLALNLHTFSAYQSYFSNVVLSLFYVFWTLKSQNIFPTKALSWTTWEAYSTLQLHQSCCCFSHYEHVSCSYTLGTFHANDVNFFFSSTFDQTKYLKYSCSYISIQNNEYQQNINKNFEIDQWKSIRNRTKKH